jgi:hypothetical protein
LLVQKDVLRDFFLFDFFSLNPKRWKVWWKVDWVSLHASDEIITDGWTDRVRNKGFQLSVNSSLWSTETLKRPLR